METRSFTFDQELSEAYLHLCWRLYGDDPCWIPPDRHAFLARFRPEFGFYRDPANAHRHFVLLDGQELVAHVSAFVNAALTDDGGAPVGALGCFEASSDDDATRALIEAAAHWLADHGRGARIWAPLDFDIWHGYRFRTRGFGERPFLGEPCNRAWYPDLFASLGFSVLRRWSSIEVEGEAALRALAESGAARHRERVADGYRFEEADARGTDDLERLHRMVSDSYRGFLGYTPVSLAEFVELYGPLWRSFGSALTTMVFDPGGEPVGFCVAYPDAGEAPRLLRCRRGWLARWRAMNAVRRSDRVVFYLAGITQRELAKRHGLGRAAFCDAMRRTLAAGYRKVVFAILAEGSPSRSVLAAHVDDARVEYALYQREERR